MREIAGGVDQAGHFLPAEDVGQAPWRFWIREIGPQVRPLECPGEEELHGRHALLHGIGRQLSVAQQMELKLANMFRPELIRRLVEVVGEVPQCADVGVYGTLGVITTLELIQHQFSKMGHRALLVAPTTNMHTGSHGRYSWLVSHKMGIGPLLAHCPRALLGRYVVIASFDSGPLALNETERGMGWHVDGGLAYTSKVDSVDARPYENFDEWYVFESPVPITDCEVSVNFGGFTFEAPPAPDQTWDPTWDRISATEAAERITMMQARFWSQLERIGAESYLSDGDCFLFASANQAVFEDAVAAFTGHA